jgi:hypothetical protein
LVGPTAGLEENQERVPTPFLQQRKKWRERALGEFLQKTEKRNGNESGCPVSPCTKPREWELREMEILLCNLSKNSIKLLSREMNRERRSFCRISAVRRREECVKVMRGAFVL